VKLVCKYGVVFIQYGAGYAAITNYALKFPPFKRKMDAALKRNFCVVKKPFSKKPTEL